MTSTTNDVAIRVRDLGKCYQIYDQPQDRLKQSLLPRLLRLIGKQGKDFYREFWALRDVSFDIGHGETVGIVGRNGSGKSTLLQIICGTLTPTQGEVQVGGRVAALLELGAGFNPEFTGRENVYLNAGVLGLSRDEIDQRFDAITEFADVGQFIDQPIKTYSSGMVVRLAFAVAINVDPEILIIDEALSVGDERFQRKCFSRIEDIRASGATILFVSHSGATVIDLCDQAILLDDGTLLEMGAPKQTVGRYQRLLYAAPHQRAKIRDEILAKLAAPSEPTADVSAPLLRKQEPGGVEGTTESFDPSLTPSSTIKYEPKGVEIADALVATTAGARINNLVRGSDYYFRYNVRFFEPATNVRFGMLIKTVAGVELGGATSSANMGAAIPFVSAGTVYCVSFYFSCSLNPGIYFLNAGVLGVTSRGPETFLHRLLDVAMFRVLPEAEDTATGPVYFKCSAHLAPTTSLPANQGIPDHGLANPH